MTIKYCDRCGQKIENDVYKVQFYGESGDNSFGGVSIKTAEINCYPSLIDDRDYCLDCLTAIREFAYKDMKKRDLENLSGISHYTINKLNRGENVTTEVLGKICIALNCTMDDIMEIIPDE